MILKRVTPTSIITHFMYEFDDELDTR